MLLETPKSSEAQVDRKGLQADPVRSLHTAEASDLADRAVSVIVLAFRLLSHAGKWLSGVTPPSDPNHGCP